MVCVLGYAQPGLSGDRHLFPIPIARGQTPLPPPFAHHNIYSRCWLSGWPCAAVRWQRLRLRRTLIHDENKTAVAISHQRAVRSCSVRARAVRRRPSRSRRWCYPGADVHTHTHHHIPIDRTLCSLTHAQQRACVSRLHHYHAHGRGIACLYLYVYIIICTYYSLTYKLFHRTYIDVYYLRRTSSYTMAWDLLLRPRRYVRGRKSKPNYVLKRFIFDLGLFVFDFIRDSVVN